MPPFPSRTRSVGHQSLFHYAFVSLLKRCRVGAPSQFLSSISFAYGPQYRQVHGYPAGLLARFT